MSRGTFFRNFWGQTPAYWPVYSSYPRTMAPTRSERRFRRLRRGFKPDRATCSRRGSYEISLLTTNFATPVPQRMGLQTRLLRPFKVSRGNRCRQYSALCVSG